jgi:hypothetical protein
MRDSTAVPAITLTSSLTRTNQGMEIIYGLMIRPPAQGILMIAGYSADSVTRRRARPKTAAENRWLRSTLVRHLIPSARIAIAPMTDIHQRLIPEYSCIRSKKEILEMAVALPMGVPHG